MKHFAVAALLLLALGCNGAAWASQDPAGVVTGLVALDGLGPMMNGAVVFFAEQSESAPQSRDSWRAPSYSFRVDENGRFEAHLPEGRYTMGALERNAYSDPAPPVAEEHFFMRQDQRGKTELLTVVNGGKLELGLVVGKP